MKTKVSFLDNQGLQQEVSLGLNHWAAAQKQNLSLRQFINRTYETSDPKFDTFTQMCQSVGMYTAPCKELGMRPITMAEVEYGGLEFAAGTQGSEVNPVQTKILFPAVIAELVENKLQLHEVGVVEGKVRDDSAAGFDLAPEPEPVDVGLVLHPQGFELRRIPRELAIVLGQDHGPDLGRGGVVFLGLGVDFPQRRRRRKPVLHRFAAGVAGAEGVGPVVGSFGLSRRHLSPPFRKAASIAAGK